MGRAQRSVLVAVLIGALYAALTGPRLIGYAVPLLPPDLCRWAVFPTSYTRSCGASAGWLYGIAALVVPGLLGGYAAGALLPRAIRPGRLSAAVTAALFIEWQFFGLLRYGIDLAAGQGYKVGAAYLAQSPGWPARWLILWAATWCGAALAPRRQGAAGSEAHLLWRRPAVVSALLGAAGPLALWLADWWAWAPGQYRLQVGWLGRLDSRAPWASFVDPLSPAAVVAMGLAYLCVGSALSVLYGRRALLAGPVCALLTFVTTASFGGLLYFFTWFYIGITPLLQFASLAGATVLGTTLGAAAGLLLRRRMR